MEDREPNHDHLISEEIKHFSEDTEHTEWKPAGKFLRKLLMSEIYIFFIYKTLSIFIFMMGITPGTSNIDEQFLIL